MPNLIVEWMNCYGNTEPGNNAPQAALLKPITFELRSLQTVANAARRNQMRILIDKEMENYEKELKAMNKGIIYDASCYRCICEHRPNYTDYYSDLS